MIASDDYPYNKCNYRDADDDRNKDTADAIHYFLDGSFATLSFLYHAYNLSEYGSASYLGRVQDERSPLIYCPCQYAVSRLLFYRNSFTADHTFIDIGIPVDYNTIYRDLFSRAYADFIVWL